MSGDRFKYDAPVRVLPPRPFSTTAIANEVMRTLYPSEYGKNLSLIAGRELVREVLDLLLGDLHEQWFVCCHPAWPDPLPAGDNVDTAVETLKFARSGLNSDAGWLLRTLEGGRAEFRGDSLIALLRNYK